ncbi:MAG: SMP-30/gluconolactonase/LRE family protein [Halioglobus sp.]|nr:SMP-30/gluconolactonase/LRE family protein [Halioglobus sp.]
MKINQPLTWLALATAVATTACSDSSDAPAQPLLDRYELSSPDSVPEGVAFDPVDRAFYATSLQGGSITRIAADGTESLFRPADDRARIGGAKVDPAARRLWVCATQVDGLDDRVWVFDLDTGGLVLEFFLGALSTGGSCNDLALDDSGAAFVTDPANPFIYRLDPDSGEGTVFASDPLFADASGAGLGLNGIAVSADGSALIVARFFPAALLRVNLPDGDVVTPVALSGDDLPAPDGLAVLDGDVYAVSGEAVSRVRPNTDGTAATVTTVPQISGLSTATVAEGALYVIKSDVVNFVLGRPLNPPFEIFRVDLEAFDD